MSIFSKRARTPDAVKTTAWIPASGWAGESVTETSALEVSAVLACVSLLADSVAALPLRAVRRVGDRTEAVAAPGWLDASPTVTRYELLHMIVASLALHGNAFVWVDRQGGVGAPIALQPLHPLDVQVQVRDGARWYSCNGYQLDAANVVHLRWWTPPQAARGLAPIELQKTTIGLALAMERHLAQFYGEGATPSSVLEVDGDLTAEQAQTLQATWETQNRRRRRPAVLTGGMKWRPITASAADMQMNEARQLQVAQIARIFRVPAHMVGAPGDSQTYQNTESAGINFVTYTLLPYLARVEQALSALLPAGYEVRFDTAAFLRADTITRYRAHQLGIASGFLTPNEARAVENLEPYAGGDEFVMALPGAPMAGPGIDPPPAGTDATPPS